MWLKKSLFRPWQRVELGAVYFGCFAFVSLLLGIENRAATSYVLEKYFKFLIEHSTEFALALSLTAVVFHYRFLATAKTEVRCRVLVGDTVAGIRVRYGLECFFLLILCCGLFFLLDISLGFSVSNNFYLLAVLLVYLMISLPFVRLS